MRTPAAKPRPPVKLHLPPPGRVIYEVDLPADAEIIIKAPPGLEVCGGRVHAETYRVWTRRVAARKPPQGAP